MNESPFGPKSEKKSDALGSFGYVVIALCLALAGSMAYWHFHNRKWLGPTFNADVEFTVAPETARPGAASLFVVHVEQDNKNTPLPGRVMDITVTPRNKAQIISVSGASGARYAVQSQRAKARTDSSGNVQITLRASEPGKYTLVALDSASNKEGTVNFQVTPRGG
jgi:hypothetical protein